MQQEAAVTVVATAAAVTHTMRLHRQRYCTTVSSKSNRQRFHPAAQQPQNGMEKKYRIIVRSYRQRDAVAVATARHYTTSLNEAVRQKESASAKNANIDLRTNGKQTRIRTRIRKKEK